DGVARTLAVTGWTDTTITAQVTPAVLSPAGMNCPIQQQVQYGGPATTAPAKCGQLVITAASGKQSIDAVTVTIGGKAPFHVTATGVNSSIQKAIDNASPGDMLMIDPAIRATSALAAVPAVHQEMLLMWKPVRLQGVGAPASVIDGNPHPAARGKVNPFDPNRIYSCPSDSSTTPLTTATANFNGTNTTLRYFSGRPDSPQIDRLPLEAVVGWDATQNGNMAELLQEPSLMGAFEGAGITVLSKGLLFPAGAEPYGLSLAEEGSFPVNTLLLNNSTSATPPPSPAA